MYSVDIGLLWTYLASMFAVILVAGLSIGLIAWYTGNRKKPAGVDVEEVQAEKAVAGKGAIRRRGRKHIPHGV